MLVIVALFERNWGDVEEKKRMVMNSVKIHCMCI